MIERACHLRVGHAVGAVALAAALNGCAPAPFDAGAPWTPLQADDTGSFAGPQQASVPNLGFDLFDRNVPPPQSDVARADKPEGNPWATQPENVVVQVCYGRLFNGATEVRESARALCPAGARLRLLGQDRVWNDCPLLQPARAAFRCLPPERASRDDAGVTGRN